MASRVDNGGLVVVPVLIGVPGLPGAGLDLVQPVLYVTAKIKIAEIAFFNGEVILSFGQRSGG